MDLREQTPWGESREWPRDLYMYLFGECLRNGLANLAFWLAG